MHAQDEHGHPGFMLLDFAQDLEPAASRHGDVEDHNVPVLLPDEVQRLLGVSSFAEGGALELIGQNLLQPVANYCVIVG